MVSEKTEALGILAIGTIIPEVLEETPITTDLEETKTMKASEIIIPEVLEGALRIMKALEIIMADSEGIMKEDVKRLLRHQEKIMADSEEIMAVVSDSKDLKILHQAVVTTEGLEEVW